MDFKFLFNANEKESMKDLQKMGAIKDCLINEELGTNYLGINKEHLPVLLVLDSMITIKERNSSMKVHIEDYLREYRNKVIEGIIAKHENGTSAYTKVDINIDKLKCLSSAVYLELEGNKIKKYKAAIGGSDITPFRLYEIENLAVGKEIEYLNKEKTVNMLRENVSIKIKNKTNTDVGKDIIGKIYKDTLNNALNRVKEKID